MSTTTTGAPVPDPPFTGFEAARVAAWEAREAAPEGWKQRVAGAADAIQGAASAWQVPLGRWVAEDLAAAALTADAALAGQPTTDGEAERG
jgi:hypothetical protein